jgi:hypothetical protein
MVWWRKEGPGYRSWQRTGIRGRMLRRITTQQHQQRRQQQQQEKVQQQEVREEGHVPVLI